MRKAILVICMFLFNFAQAHATAGYRFYEAGSLYTNVSYPRSVAKDINAVDRAELAKLKKGTSSAKNIMNIAEFGDASIHKAAKDGNITKIHYVDTKVDKVWIPSIFFIREVRTVVYGE